jgi:hypothetical protein
MYFDNNVGESLVPVKNISNDCADRAAIEAAIEAAAASDRDRPRLVWR